MATVCVGASAQCISTCLVFTGQNQAVKYNDYSKLFTQRALFFQPLAFARMLMAAVGKHVDYCARGVTFSKGNKVVCDPYVRMNVYSDIPWELFFPEFFDFCASTYPNLWMYDYTKVPGRGPRPKKNYDLTFSYSGENWDDCKAALRNRQRVAVVFARGTARGTKVPNAKTGTVAYKPAETLADLRLFDKKNGDAFEGFPVIDGDLYDMRPLDLAPVIVGLRFKTPRKVIKNAGGDFVLKPPKPSEKLVVWANFVDGHWIFPITPAQTNVELLTELDQEQTGTG